jgi:hypothetical protein
MTIREVGPETPRVRVRKGETVRLLPGDYEYVQRDPGACPLVIGEGVNVKVIYFASHGELMDGIPRYPSYFDKPIGDQPAIGGGLMTGDD